MTSYSTGSSSALVETLREGCTDQYLYSEPKRGLNVYRSPRKFNPTNTQTFTTGNNDVIRIRMPNDCPTDFRRAFLLADISITVTGGTYKRMSYGSWSFIDKLRYHSSGDTIEEIQYYNRVYSALWTLGSNPDYLNALGPNLLYTGSQATRNATAAAGTFRVAIPILLGYFGVGVIPLNAFKNIYQELEIYLAPASTFVETDGTNPVVTISNIDLHVEQIGSWNGSYERSLVKIVDEGRFTVWFRTFTTFQNNVINQQSDLVIANRQESVERIDSWMYDTGTLTNTGVNDKFITFPKNNAFSYQLKFNNRLWPDEEVRTDGTAPEGYINYLRSIEQWKLEGMPGFQCGFPEPRVSLPNINQTAYNLNDFFMVADLRNSPEAEVLNNFSTEANSNDVIFKLKLLAIPPPQTALLSMVGFFTLARFLPSGKVLIRS